MTQYLRSAMIAADVKIHEIMIYYRFNRSVQVKILTGYSKPWFYIDRMTHQNMIHKPKGAVSIHGFRVPQWVKSAMIGADVKVDEIMISY